jgi:L-iditol 2-dehydrogenase
MEVEMLQSIMIEPGKIEFRNIPKPEIKPDEILMHTRRIGVCGSDIHVFHGLHPYTSYPVVQGHEVSGVVAAVGDNVEGFSVGDKITFTPQVTCGKCYPCQHGMYHICETLKVMGFQTDGSGQEYFPLPAWNALKLPEDFPLDYGALVEPIAVAVHALQRNGDVEGKNVLVLGAGTIGNLTAQTAKAMGAKAVMITDISGYKLKKAKACDIDFVINTSEQNLTQAIADHFGPHKADLILECVGIQPTVDQAIENARKGTSIVIVGVFGEKPTVDLGLVQDRELSLVGTLMYQKVDFEKAIDLIADGKMCLEDLVTHRFKFQGYLDAYHAIEESNGEYMKVMIELD